MKSKSFGRQDKILLIVLAIILVIFAAVFYFVFSAEGDYVEVRVDGELYGTYSLQQEQEIAITNEQGIVTNYLKIANGQADMIEANCPDKTCVRHKAISKQNESIVCLPNQIIVTVFAEEESDLDAITN